MKEPWQGEMKGINGDGAPDRPQMFGKGKWKNTRGKEKKWGEVEGKGREGERGESSQTITRKLVSKMQRSKSKKGMHLQFHMLDD